MRWKFRRSVVNACVLAGAGLVSVTAGAAVGLATSAAPTKSLPSNPEAGLSDTQRAAIHAAAHARNISFLNDFVSHHGNPRLLKVIEVSSYAAPLATREQAEAAADLITHGRVLSVLFQADSEGGMPQTITTIEVLQTVKGQAGAHITVRQLGGPVAQVSGGALVQMDTDQLLLPGDEAILMLKRDVSGGYWPLLGAGVNLVRNGRVTVEDSNPFGAEIKARSLAEALSILSH